MVAEPMQLFSDGDPRGRRYEPADREAAFGHWYTHRSFTKTADAQGIAINTIRAWYREDGWEKRALDLHDEAIETAQFIIARRASAEIDKNFETLTGLRDNATSEKVRLDATIYLNGMIGVVVPKSSTTVNVGELSATRRRNDEPGPDFAAMTPEELRAYDEAIRSKRKRHVA